MKGAVAVDDVHICCFTGYRPHRFAFAPDGLRPEHVKNALAQQIEGLYRRGCTTFISGMCVGVDLWSAAAVLELRRRHPEVRLIAAVPFEGQEIHWPAADQREYSRVLDACDEVHLLSEPPHGSEEAAEKYRLRNRWMVDNADTVLAVFTDLDNGRHSGTAATVRYARRLQRRIITIHPETLATAEETVVQLQLPL